MSAKILGVSGSPIRNSNTDRAVKTVLESSGVEHDFVKLSELNLEPCRACLGCVRDGQCVVRDDGQELAEKFQAADGLVLGAFTPYSSLDARSKAFMERMYCFRHQKAGNAGKLCAAVITTACPPETEHMPPAAETAGAQIQYWAMEEAMELLGTMVVIGNVPCIRCGYGDSCPASGVQMLHGPSATVESVGVRRFEDDNALVEKAKELGRTLGARISV